MDKKGNNPQEFLWETLIQNFNFFNKTYFKILHNKIFVKEDRKNTYSKICIKINKRLIQGRSSYSCISQRPRQLIFNFFIQLPARPSVKFLSGQITDA